MADFIEDFNDYALSKLPVPRDNFNYSTKALADSAWIAQDEPDNQVDVVNEKYAYTVKRDGTNTATTLDLGAPISDIIWTLRAKVFIDTLVLTTGSGAGISIGISDTSSATGQLSLNNTIAMSLTNASTGGGQEQHVSVDGLDGTLTGTVGSTTAFSASETVYVEIKRLSQTEMQTTIYTDASFSVIRDRVNRVISAGITGLRFIRFDTPDDNVVSFDGTLTGTIDNIELWDEGSQGDVTFQDNFLLKPTTFTDDFSVDNWTTSNATFINVSGGVNNFDLPITTTANESSIRDLGANTMSDENWSLRFKCDLSTFVINSDATGQSIHIGISSTDQTSTSDLSQDYIGFKIVTAGSGSSYQLIGADAQGPDTGGAIRATSSRSPSVETIFVEVIRVNSTTIELRQYTDATFTTLLESITGTTPSTITGLRYFKVMAKNVDGTANGDITGSIDDLEFYNGNSTLTDWTVTGTKIVLNTNTEVIDWDAKNDNTQAGIVHDLQSSIGVNADDDNWTLRFKLIIDTATVIDVTSSQLFMTVSDTEAVDDTTAEDYIGMRMVLNNANDSFRMRDGDGIAPVGGGDDVIMSTTLTGNVGTPLFIEIKRTSATTYQGTIYSDSNFRNILETALGSCTSTTDGLRFLKFFKFSSAGTTSDLDGTIDDVEFYNGVSVPRTPISELPKLFEDRVDTDKGWVTTDGTAMAVNTGTQVLDIDVFRDSSQDAIAFDLGAGVLSETRWGLRFKYDIQTIDPANTGTKRIACGIFDTNQVASIASPQDYIGINFNLATDTTNINSNATNNSNPQSISFGKTFVLGTQVQIYYVEIIRISATSYSVEIFSDPDYAVSIEKQTVDNISSLISGLRYIKFLGDETSGPVAGSFTGIIDDIQLWNDQAPLDHRNKWRVLDL